MNWTSTFFFFFTSYLRMGELWQGCIGRRGWGHFSVRVEGAVIDVWFIRFLFKTGSLRLRIKGI